MDRIDILHEVAEKEGAEIFWSREGKLRKALHGTALTFADMEDIIEICTTDRKITKRILSEPDLAATRDLQKALVDILGNRSIAPLRDIHTALYGYEGRTVTDPTGEFDDGRYVYETVPARRQCLSMLRPLNPPAYELVLPDTVNVNGKDWKIISIADGCFEGNTAITSVELPSGLEALGKNAFCNCSSLASAKFPRHLKTIGANAFAYTKLREAKLGEYADEIGSMAFYRCRDLRTVCLPKRTGQIGAGAFAGCESLENIEVDRNNGRFVFTDGVLYSRKMDRLVQVVGTFKGKLAPPRGLVAVEQYAAEDCAGITEVDLPAPTASVGACAFRGCTGISKTRFPNTLTTVGERAFEGCTSLRSVSLPDSVRTIGKKAFSGCTGLETGEIAGAVDYRGKEVFSGCTGLNRMTVRKGSEFSDKDFPQNTRVKFVHG